MNWFHKSILAIAAASSVGSAQVKESFFRTMTWSWAGSPKFLGSKSFQSDVDWGYFQDYTPSFGIPNIAIEDRSFWRHVAYTGLTGKRVVAWGDWGLPQVKPAYVDAGGTLRDGCGHTHITYAVWLLYGYYSGGVYQSGAVGPLDGGSFGGMRVNNYCRHDVAGAHETWGKTAFVFDFPKTGNIWTAMILGGVANSHGAGLCGSSFACINQPWLGAYAVPY
jgi:hypothetical protein